MKSNDELIEHFRLTARQKSALKKLGIETVRDLLYHFPRRYENIGAAKLIADALPGEHALFYGKITSLEKRLSWKSKKYVVEATLQDSSGEITLMWFNQVYMEKMLQGSPILKVSGKVTGKKKLYIANPDIEFLPALPDFLDSEDSDSTLMPVYSESAGITSRWFFYAVKRALNETQNLQDLEILDKEILQKYKLPELASALRFIHNPKKEAHFKVAQKRFAFEEVFKIQIEKLQARRKLQKEKSVAINADKDAQEKMWNFTKRFGFALTGAQKRAIEDLVLDFKKPYPEQRLLQGDVGSGKTAVASAAAYLVFKSKSPNNKYKSLQTAYMAPTEILANQIFEDFLQFFSKESGARIALVTSSQCKIFPSKTQDGASKVSCAQVKKWIKEGIVPIVVGTHALIFKSVEFENLAFVIVDEQHRFGTMQRARLARKDGAKPYLLSMSATPIPRTLALSIYGDLELSVLDELPKGRKEIKTKLVQNKDRDKVYDFVKKELNAGRQAYVICPRIEEPDPEKANALRLKSVQEELERLSKGPFKGYRLAPLHGKMSAKEKDKTMQEFAEGKIDILVATSVVEVGVNVPNASTIIIEGAERFGLSQLHQLRGRVRRSSNEAFCFLFSDAKSKKSFTRLKALESSRDGFELAEKDLELRGPGDLYGSKQWGLSDLGMQALKNTKMLEYARKEAQALIQSDPELKKHDKLREFVQKQKEKLHLE